MPGKDKPACKAVCKLSLIHFIIIYSIVIVIITVLLNVIIVIIIIVNLFLGAPAVQWVKRWPTSLSSAHRPDMTEILLKKT